MTNPLAALDALFPVDLIGPDLSAYRQGTHGIDYVHTFDSGRPGPHVAISALVHGNEPCGAVALDGLLREAVRPVRGKLSLLFANVEAYQAFDPGQPNLTRYLDEDMNRVWGPAGIGSQRQSRELTRARVLAPFVETIDLLLDLHSMQYATRALVLTGQHPRAMKLARMMAMPDLVVADRGHAQGPRMRDFAGFDDPKGSKTALLVECGQHWDRASAGVALSCSVRFLEVTGAVDTATAQQLAQALAAPPQTPAHQSFVEVTHPVTIASDAFAFTEPFQGLEVIPKAGTVIAMDGDTPVATPHDDCILIMPNRRLWKGQTAVRLGRFVDPATVAPDAAA